MENHHHQHLSDEISIHILSRLPADSIIRFKLVCKAWRSIIEEDPVFHDMHEHHQVLTTACSSMGFVSLESVMQGFSSSTHYVRFAEYKQQIDMNMNMNRIKRWKLPFREYYDTPPINPEDHPPINPEEKKNKLAIVGSCNGLVCISTTHDYKPNHHTFVCNPWTGDDQVLDISSDDFNDIDDNVIFVGIGFGYLLSTNEYKVVRIYASSKDKTSIKHVQVYTLRSRSHRRHREEDGRWRTIRSSSSSWSDISFVSRPRNLSPLFFEDYPVFKLGVALNGALYFNNYRNIVLFDLANEEFRIIVAPPPAVPDRDIDGLGVLGGSLCATKSRHLINPVNGDSNRTTDVWVMEEKDNNKEEKEEESWIKKFSLPVPPKNCPRFSSYVPLGALASPPRILLHPNYVERKEQIVSYNPETDDSYCLDIPGYWDLSDTPIPYFKSLVSLGQSHRLTFSDINRITVLLKTD